MTKRSRRRSFIGTPCGAVGDLRLTWTPLPITMWSRTGIRRHTGLHESAANRSKGGQPHALPQPSNPTDPHVRDSTECSGGRNETADLYSIFDLRSSDADMEPVSNRNCRASVADAVKPPTWYKGAIHAETA